MPEIKYIVESLLFVSKDPLSIDRIKHAIPDATNADLLAAIDELAQEYEQRTGGFALRHVAGGYQLRTRPEFAGHIRRLHASQPVRLSNAALETLAIIAYKQPALRSDIEHIRGVDSGGVLRVLLEKKLVRVLGRKDIPGRPMIYATTKRFLEIFDLKDLTELPSLEDIKEMGFGPQAGAMDQEEETPPGESARPGEDPPLFKEPEAKDQADETKTEEEKMLDGRDPAD